MRKLLAATVVAGLLLIPTPVQAAQTIGFPTFSGGAIPQPPVSYTTGDMMRAIYDAESGGTDFWIDRLLGRTGSDPSDADGGILMTRGRALFMKVHNPSVIGFGGQVAYYESINNQNAYSVAITPGTFTEQVGQRWQGPSHWRSVHTSGSVRVNATKFITEQNVAVTNLSITNSGSASTTLQLRATSPYATSGSGSELTGQVNAYNGLTTLFPRLSGDSGFTVTSGELNRSVTVGAGQTVTAKVVMGFVTNEIPESRTEYDAYRGYDNATAFATHVRAYHRWWADNVPYIDVPEPAIKKNIYYRWWLMRFNHLDADIPGQTFQFPTSLEGVLGYNNAIVLTQPMHIDDLKYLRNPMYGYGPWLSVGTVSRNGRYVDNPGDPANWSNSYTQYISEAAWRSYQIHGGQPAMLANLARYAEQDVKGQLSFYDHDNDGVIEYDWGALTGNDADAVSFHWRDGWLDRAEGAYVYSNAMAAVRAYQTLGNTAKATEMQQLADRVRNGIVNQLWNPNRQLLEHRHVSSNEFVPWKEINNYYPYSVGLMPNTDQYRQALRLFDDPADYPIFPFFTANQRDKAAAAAAGNPGSNNFSTINSTVQFRLFSSVLRNYPNQWMTAEHYKKLLYWNTWAQYVNGNTAWPDANEFWANWNAGAQRIDYRSWIHHNILGSANWTVIEDVAGLRPRDDRQVELWPINIGWSHFAINNVRYRGHDLSIVWDDPADGVTRYNGVPQGYSIYVDGARAVTVDRLTRVLYDPANGAVSLPAGGTVQFNAASPLVAPSAVALTGDRIVDVFAKAGVDLTSTTPNLARGVSATASFTAGGTSTGAAVDGFTINDPIWGAAGSPNTQDWYELNFGQARTVDELRLYFRDSRPQNSTYRAPSSYTVQYLNGTTWTNVASEVKAPAAPRANYNRVRFTPVSTQRIRVLVTHASGSKAGLTEVQAYQRGGTPPPPTGNRAPAATPSASYTSSWESVAAINDGIDPPSSNDTVNPRWGTWPNEGAQWAELTWPSAVDLSRAEVYFFDDGQGIDLPASWQLQYWNGSAYVDIAATYPRAADQYNVVSFPAVSTTRLRVVLQSAADS
ncbi:discoidin domain-containing protein, partial [Actinomycetes bacterium KLBMP 9797]